jgi:hypothetical protein
MEDSWEIAGKLPSYAEGLYIAGNIIEHVVAEFAAKQFFRSSE